MRNPFKCQPRPLRGCPSASAPPLSRRPAARLIRKPQIGPNADADLCALAGPWRPRAGSMIGAWKS